MKLFIGCKRIDAVLELRRRLVLLGQRVDEEAEEGAAVGYARATGKPGVVLVTSGPGATNTVTGCHTAD